MRPSQNTVLLAALGAALAVASCTLITDVDRTRIPDGATGGGAGAASGGAPGAGGSTGGAVGEGGAGTGGAGTGGAGETGGSAGFGGSAGAS